MLALSILGAFLAALLGVLDGGVVTILVIILCVLAIVALLVWLVGGRRRY
jgi:hypothetical protein